MSAKRNLLDTLGGDRAIDIAIAWLIWLVYTAPMLHAIVQHIIGAISPDPWVAALVYAWGGLATWMAWRVRHGALDELRAMRRGGAT